MPARVRFTVMLAGIVVVAASPCAAADSVSRAVTVFVYRTVPPAPVTEAVTRPVTVFMNPVPPEGPVTEAVSRPVTLFNRADFPPGPVTEAMSRPLTVFRHPVPPEGPGTEALSRPVTIFHYAISPPVLIVEVISRALTVRYEAQSAVTETILPERLSMQDGRPNPFHPSTMIRFSLPFACNVELAIYDIRGARVVTLVDAGLPAGDQKVVWDGIDQKGAPVAAGLYFARLKTPAGIRAVKLTLSR